MYRFLLGMVKKAVCKRRWIVGSENTGSQASQAHQTVRLIVSLRQFPPEIPCFPGAKLVRVLLFAQAKQVGREHCVMSDMMKEFAYFCRVMIPLIPPFVILVAL